MTKPSERVLCKLDEAIASLEYVYSQLTRKTGSEIHGSPTGVMTAKELTNCILEDLRTVEYSIKSES